MIITDAAKPLVLEALEQNNADSLEVVVLRSCCSSSWVLGYRKLQEGDAPEFINGIPVIMDEAGRKWAEKVTLEVKSGLLNTRDDHEPEPETSCSC